MPRKKKASEEENVSAKKETSSKRISESEYKEKVVNLAKGGLTSEKIGEALRKEGVHPQEFGKKISKILKDENLYLNPDLKNIEKKLVKISTHYEKNKKDRRAMREMTRIAAKVRKTKQYLKIPTR
ncbi:MAG TPA: hypothetical protein VJZ93_00450 [Candidatus Nanoarchaeia archaeon]|nr:hypothetical protein [Candidatus Nanoarchaeia archaeon]